MRRFVVILVVCLVSTQLLASSSDAAWKSDIEYLTQELPRLHKNAFFQVSKESFESSSSALVRALPTLSDPEVVVRVYQLVAMIGDGHTRADGWPFTFYPLSYYWFEDGLYVTRVAADHGDLLGRRLVAIDGHPIEEVTAAVSTVLAHENDSLMRSNVPSYLAAAEVLLGLGITSRDREATFTFELADGVRIERALPAGVTATSWREPPVATSQRDPKLNYWAEYWGASQAIFLKYNRCQNDPAKPFLTFLNEFMASLGDRPIQKVIIDLRDNGGGDSSVFQPALSVIQSNPEINRADRLFVLIGRRTFSSAVINAMQLDQQTNAILVGEPTGGKPNHYGEVRTFTLPWSRLTISYSTKYFVYVSDSDPASLEPNVTMRPSAAAFFAGRDNVFDALIPPPPKRRAASPR